MSDKSGMFFFGFAIGVLAGAATALLLAPASGEEMRHQIGQKGIELKGQAEKLAGETRAQVQHLVEEAKDQMEHAQERGRVILSENVKKAQQAVQDAQTKLGKAESTS